MDPRLTTDQFILALCIFREARGESLPAKAGMLAVIRNRASDPKYRWPRTTTGVITEPFQFSSFNPADPNAKVWPDVSLGPGGWQAWADCCDLVAAPLEADPTNGATNYEATPDGKELPAWADPAKKTVQIGRTRFYKL